MSDPREPAPGLFDAVLARGGTREATSDRAWLAAMLEVEAALAGATADVGALDRGVADAVAAGCRPDRVDPAAIGADAASAGNPVVPLVKALRTTLRADGAPAAAAAVHRGATSQDVVDTAAVLVARRALDVVATDLRAAADAAAGLARTHRDLPAAGRTLLQQAAPVTVGLRAAGWASGLDAAADALAAVRKAKSEAKVSMRTDVETATVTAAEEQVALVEAARADLVDAGRIATLSVVAGTAPLTVDVVLAPSAE